MASTDEQLDELMEHCKKHEDPTGENGFLRQLFRTTLHQEKRAGMTENQVSVKKEWK
jgi:hypothetical protein